jgi:hypothetical protein
LRSEILKKRISMKNKIKCVNIEAGMPTAAVAEKTALFEISTAKREGIKVLKIIHGYGSTGMGGKIKTEIGKLLALKKKEGLVKAFVNGGDWDIFNQSARDMLDACNELRQDSDLGNHNSGITIVLL